MVRVEALSGEEPREKGERELVERAVREVVEVWWRRKEREKEKGKRDGWRPERESVCERERERVAYLGGKLGDEKTLARD